MKLNAIIGFYTWMKNQGFKCSQIFHQFWEIQCVQRAYRLSWILCMNFVHAWKMKVSRACQYSNNFERFIVSKGLTDMAEKFVRILCTHKKRRFFSIFHSSNSFERVKRISQNMLNTMIEFCACMKNKGL